MSDVVTYDTYKGDKDYDNLDMEEQCCRTDSIQSEIVEKLKFIFPNASALNPKLFSGDYANFLKNWIPTSASIYQYLAIGLKNINITEIEINEHVEVLKQNGITFVREDQFKAEYLEHCSINIPIGISFYIQPSCVERYLDLNAEFMFNKIKKHLH